MTEKKLDKTVRFEWLNSGNPFVVPSFTVGLQKKILEFQEEHAEEYATANRDKVDKKEDTPAILKANRLDWDLQLLIIFETIKKKFPDITMQQIEDNMTLQDVVDFLALLMTDLPTTGESRSLPLQYQNSKPKSKAS
jgi:hypothetical protein